MFRPNSVKWSYDSRNASRADPAHAGSPAALAGVEAARERRGAADLSARFDPQGGPRRHRRGLASQGARSRRRPATARRDADGRYRRWQVDSAQRPRRGADRAIIRDAADDARPGRLLPRLDSARAPRSGAAAMPVAAARSRSAAAEDSRRYSGPR